MPNEFDTGEGRFGYGIKSDSVLNRTIVCLSAVGADTFVGQELNAE